LEGRPTRTATRAGCSTTATPRECTLAPRRSRIRQKPTPFSTRARQAYSRALAAPPGCLAPADEARICAWLGALDLEAGRAGSALELLARALARGDRDLTTVTNRAVALEALGRAGEAADAWAEVAARAGDSALGARARERRAHLGGR